MAEMNGGEVYFTGKCIFQTQIWFGYFTEYIFKNKIPNLFISMYQKSLKSDSLFINYQLNLIKCVGNSKYIVNYQKSEFKALLWYHT